MTSQPTRSVLAVLCATFILLAGAGCNFDSSANTAHGCETCAPGMCYRGYCLQPSASLGAPGGAGAGLDRAISGGAGGGRGGNGTVGTAVGASGAGVSGAPDSCVARDETCNGRDDDCDGKVDEHSDQSCYPNDAGGCTKEKDGRFTCIGPCKAGTRACKAGKLAACVAFVVPVEEVCGEADAQDDDCDGTVDDDCPCQGDETQTCYTGPASTRDAGTCRAGTQTCFHGAFGPCEDSITPVDETCENQGADDDCNLVVDNVAGAGPACSVPENKGVCHDGVFACSGGSLQCMTPPATAAETLCDQKDENCNGETDEGFDLATDEANCGACGHACKANQLCCAGQCTETKGDAHCGRCDPCAAGSACCNGVCLANGPGTCSACTACAGALMCCAGMCVDTMTKKGHCGSCDNACAGSCTCENSQCQDREGTACPPAMK